MRATQDRKARESPPSRKGLIRRIRDSLPIPESELVVFFNQTAFLYNAGIPLIRCLYIMSQQTVNGRMQEILRDLCFRLETGFTFAEAMKLHVKTFSMIYITLVNAGEVSGKLDEMLFRAAALKEKELSLTRRLQQAATYPAFVFSGILLFVLVLGRLLVLNILPVLSAGTGELPLLTRAFVLLYTLLSHPLPLFLLAVGIYFAIRAYLLALRSERFRLTQENFLLSLPALGPLFRAVALSRFCNTLAVVLESGVSIIPGVNLSAESTGSTLCMRCGTRLQRYLQDGGLLNEGMREFEFFSPLVRDMIRVGEESGTLPDLLQNASRIMEAQVEYALLSFSAVLEPLMIAGLGIIVALLAFAVLSPLNSIIASMGG
jgi:type IV pilus assembly protein PilC